jgi:hypothetical protein
MTGDIDEPGDKDQVEDSPPEDGAAEDVSDDEIDLTVDDDIVVDSTAEMNVDALVAKIDSEDPEEAAHHREVRQKLEALDENRDDEFGSTYNFNLDEDL